MFPLKSRASYFNPRPPRGGRLLFTAPATPLMEFQSTPPARGATTLDYTNPNGYTISIHAPREGATQSWLAEAGRTGYFNPRPPRRGRLLQYYPNTTTHTISIHAPREGGDKPSVQKSTHIPISIHAPREGGDRQQERPTARHWNFNPRPPRRGRRLWSYYPAKGRKFQSTPPAKGATIPHRRISQRREISIHAPREGGDFSSLSAHARLMYFNPRPPRRGRLLKIFQALKDSRFQSTPPAKGAT